MERRKFLIGMGTAAAGSAALVGTGAFNSVTAERLTQVRVTDDANAFLRLEGAGTPGNEDYINGDGNGGQLKLDLDGNNGPAGNGVNPNAVTEFDLLFVIQNQGTQSVEVDVEKLEYNAGWGDSGTHHVELYAADTSGGVPSDLYDPSDSDVDRIDNDSTTSGNSVTLGVGDMVKVSIKVDTTSYNLGDAQNDRLVNEIRINADAVPQS
jgi:hypothetical protein